MEAAGIEPAFTIVSVVAARNRSHMTAGDTIGRAQVLNRRRT
jgi:hypothetical protein